MTTNPAKTRQRSEENQSAFRLALQRAWPLDPVSVFGALVHAIDDCDRKLTRRRKAYDLPTHAKESDD